MSAWRSVLAVCLVSYVSVVMSRNYNDVNYPNYDNNLDEDEQTELPSEPSSCSSPDVTKWDKLFIMLENSQMKEDMMLQYSDDFVKVGLQSLRAEVLELVAQSRTCCTVAVENFSRRAGEQTDVLLRQAVERLKFAIKTQQDVAVQQILEATHEHAIRLEKVESSCLDGRIKSLNTRHLVQEERTTEDRDHLFKSLQTILDQLQSLGEQLELYTRVTASRVWPAGCDTALFFPMRSPKTHAEVISHRPMNTHALTVCLWVKPTQILNKTVLFSYGNTINPLELELLLSGSSARFTVGGEANLVVANNAVKEGRWVHLCGTWSSEQGLASLWVDGKKMASSPGVAEGHELPAGGVTVLGQENANLFLRFAPQELFNAEDGFTGKMSGVNVWDRVLSDDEISEQAQFDGRSCGAIGNLVGWGASQIVEKGGVKFIY